MRKYFLVFAFFLYWLISFSQDVCNDLIFMEEGNKIITGCCIKKVKDGNIVIYSKNGETLWVEATAITIEGKYSELAPVQNKSYVNSRLDEQHPGLYLGHDYSYYRKLYTGSHGMIYFGIAFTAAGVGFNIAGLASRQAGNPHPQLNLSATELFISGAACLSIGIPLIISGSIRAANNQKAMDAIDANRGLSLRLSHDGLGVLYRF